MHASGGFAAVVVRPAYASRVGRRRSGGKVRSRELRTIALGHGNVQVEVNERPQSRRFRISLKADGRFTVSVPPFSANTEIDKWLASPQIHDWITRTDLSHRRRTQLLGLSQPGTVPLGDERRRVVYAHGERSRAFLGRLDGDLVVAVSGADEQAAAALERFMRERARRYADEAIGRYAPALGVQPKRIRIGDQGSRWGSMSTTGTVSFTWRLVLCPEWVFDYVVVHELCHIVHMDHSPKFWALVADHFPRYREAARWLEQHAAEVRCWDPAAALPDAVSELAA